MALKKKMQKLSKKTEARKQRKKRAPSKTVWIDEKKLFKEIRLLQAVAEEKSKAEKMSFGDSLYYALGSEFGNANNAIWAMVNRIAPNAKMEQKAELVRYYVLKWMKAREKYKDNK